MEIRISENLIHISVDLSEKKFVRVLDFFKEYEKKYPQSYVYTGKNLIHILHDGLDINFWKS